MADTDTDALVSTDWLQEHLGSPDVRIVDATWFMPGTPRDPRAEFEACHIPGAVFFDVDEIADESSDLPHMLPSPEKFSARVRKLGLGDGSRIVVYDANGGYIAAHRVWWTFRVFGHEDVSVLDGGLPKWLHEGRPVEDMQDAARERHFTPRFDHTLVRTREEIEADLSSGREQIVDARSAERFTGEAQEPWPGLRSGHIPGSFNVPVLSVMDGNKFNTMRSPEELRSIFEAAGVDPARPVVTTCGSGITAATLAFALHLTGNKRVAVYDGSWNEWGGADDLPVETGC